MRQATLAASSRAVSQCTLAALTTMKDEVPNGIALGSGFSFPRLVLSLPMGPSFPLDLCFPADFFPRGVVSAFPRLVFWLPKDFCFPEGFGFPGKVFIEGRKI